MLIFGSGQFAEVMQQHMRCDFTVHRRYATNGEIPFEDAKPQSLIIAIGWGGRRAVYEESWGRGFTPVGWHSNRALINGSVDQSAIIFELNNIQHFAAVGANTVLWAGNHIGHHSIIEDNCTITSHVVISGHCVIGNRSFIGVNATIRDCINIGYDCTIGQGANVVKDTKDGGIYFGNPAKIKE